MGRWESESVSGARFRLNFPPARFLTFSAGTEHFPKKPPRVTRFALRHFLRRARGDELSAAFAGFGTEVDHPVRGFDDVEIVLDDQQRVAGVHQALENFQQPAHVVEVQAGGGFVEQEERRTGVAPVSICFSWLMELAGIEIETGATPVLR